MVTTDRQYKGKSLASELGEKNLLLFVGDQNIKLRSPTNSKRSLLSIPMLNLAAPFYFESDFRAC